METDYPPTPRPAEDFAEVSSIFVESVSRRAWEVADEALRIAFTIADYAERHGESYG